VSTARVIVEPHAKQDIREARDWYESKGDNLPEQFCDDLSSVFDRIASTPIGTAIAFGRTRLKPMSRFPYIVGYIFHDGTIHITGVRHGRREFDVFEERDSI